MIRNIRIRGNKYKVFLTSPSKIIRYLQANANSKIAFDIETTGLDPLTNKIRLMSFYCLAQPEDIYVLDCFENNNWKVVLPFIAKSTLIAHNAKFDLRFLYTKGMQSIPNTYCTYIASKIYYNGLKTYSGLNSLKSNIEALLDFKLEKKVDHALWSKSDRLSTEQLIYIVEDVIYLPYLLEEWFKKLNDYKLIPTYKLELQTLKSFIWMESMGVPVDTQAWLDLAEFNTQEMLRYSEILDSLVPHNSLVYENLFEGLTNINWNSVKDIKRIFVESGMDIKSTGDEVLATLNHPLAINLRKYREAQKAIGTYGKKWLNFVRNDSRVYCDWRQFGTDTGRISCADPNFTQIPRDPRYRRSIKPKDGYVIIKSDVSQFQLRIAAQITRDPVMMRAYQQGSDLHTETAKIITGKKEVTKHDRTIAKPVNFGLLFGLGAYNLTIYAKQEYGLDLSMEEAEKYRNLFFSRYRNLKKWHIAARNNFDNETRTRLGRRRLLPDRASYTIKLNSPVQGDEADAMKRSLANLYKFHDEYKNIFWPIMLVHDEILLECKKEYAEEVKEILIKTMLEAIKITLDPVPGVVDAFIRESWAE